MSYRYTIDCDIHTNSLFDIQISKLAREGLIDSHYKEYTHTYSFTWKFTDLQKAYDCLQRLLIAVDIHEPRSDYLLLTFYNLIDEAKSYIITSNMKPFYKELGGKFMGSYLMIKKVEIEDLIADV